MAKNSKVSKVVFDLSSGVLGAAGLRVTIKRANYSPLLGEHKSEVCYSNVSRTSANRLEDLISEEILTAEDYPYFLVDRVSSRISLDYVRNIPYNEGEAIDREWEPDYSVGNKVRLLSDITDPTGDTDLHIPAGEVVEIADIDEDNYLYIIEGAEWTYPVTDAEIEPYEEPEFRDGEYPSYNYDTGTYN